MLEKIEKELLKLEEFDKMQTFGAMVLVKQDIKEDDRQKVLDYLLDENTSKTRNDVFGFLFDLGNIDITTPCQIV